MASLTTIYRALTRKDIVHTIRHRFVPRSPPRLPTSTVCRKGLIETVFGRLMHRGRAAETMVHAEGDAVLVEYRHILMVRALDIIDERQRIIPTGNPFGLRVASTIQSQLICSFSRARFRCSLTFLVDRVVMSGMILATNNRPHVLSPLDLLEKVVASLNQVKHA